MGLKKLAAKVVEYNERLDQGKASKIEPAHVEKVLHKLRKKCLELEAEVAAASSPEKQELLSKKLGVAREHIKRAEWLLAQIG